MESRRMAARIQGCGSRVRDLFVFIIQFTCRSKLQRRQAQL
jgi:hypothetical protein